MEPDQELNARRLDCPLPILKAKKSLTGMDSGQVLKIDPRHEPGLDARLRSLREADRQRASLVDRDGQGIYILHEEEIGERGVSLILPDAVSLGF